MATYLTMMVRLIDNQITDLEDIRLKLPADILEVGQQLAVARAIEKAKIYREELRWLQMAGHGNIEATIEEIRMKS